MAKPLKDIGGEKQSPQPTTSAQPATEEASAPFSQEDLTRCWEAYAESDRIGQRVYLKNTMINCKPVLKDGSTFEVGVYNPGQEDELNGGSADLLQYLRHELKNTHIQMQVRVLETNDKHLAYTSAEKYEHLLGENPVLAKLRDEFKLMPD